MLDRINNNVYFVIRIKDNTNQHILKDKLIRLTGSKGVEIKLNEINLRGIVVYNDDNQTTIELLTNNINWPASTVMLLYKKPWDIEIFLKQLKQNLQVKTFYGISENAVKSQIFVVLIVYMLLQIINRCIAKTKLASAIYAK